MLIGVPKEVKNHEYRVGLTPASVQELVGRGHQVVVECSAGEGIGFCDDDYRAVGANIAESAEAIFATAALIVKVKEPQPQECRQLSEGQTLFTFLHLAPDPLQTRLLLASKATCIAYETVTDDRGGLPLLSPMSEVAGRMAIQAGAHFLEKTYGGRGTLLGGVPGVAPGEVVILGGGVVGLNAAKMAVGLGAKVRLFDKSLPRLRQLDDIFQGRISCMFSTQRAIEEALVDADLVIGAVLIPGAAAPKLLTEQHLNILQKGAVLVDVAIDQGGCFETSKTTTHQDPIYIQNGIVHYCVANIPGGVARTSTLALNNATLPFVVALADKGVEHALEANVHLQHGLNIHRGFITNQPVFDALGATLNADYRAANNF